MIELIQAKITTAVKGWNTDLQNLANSKEIIAINFGAQKVYNGFELYLSGHIWYDEHNLWLLDKMWSPDKDYISLGRESLEFDRLIILEEYENILKKEITSSKDLYRDFIVAVGLVDGEIKRLK
ncbi:hypothetical protein [Chitinophaga arvensicola]|nr:hypothetical protein [Chitinophaga arvensicola]